MIGRWTRRGRARRELEQIRIDVDACAALFLADARGGHTVGRSSFPTNSAAYIPALHADSVFTDQAFTLLREFFGPAEQANAFLNSAADSAGAQRFMCLLAGKGNVEHRDGNGTTLHDRVMKELAEALSKLNGGLW